MSNWGNALAGAVAGFAHAGTEMADARLKEDADMRAADRKLSDAERLLATKDMIENRAEERKRTRLSGTIQTARDSAMANGPTSPADMNGAIKAGLINSGDLDAAKSFDAMSDSGKKVIPWGSSYVDGDGSVLYDNGSALRGMVQQQNADAKTASAAAKGAPKALGQEQLDRITAQSKKIVQDTVGFAKNPFADIGEDPKSAADHAKQSLLTSTLSTASVNAAVAGKTLNPSEAVSQIRPVVDQFDKRVTADARKYAQQFFDEDGKPKEGALQELQKAGVPDIDAQDRNSFMRYYRDQRLSSVSEFNAFRKEMQKGSRPGAAEASETRQKPSAADKPKQVTSLVASARAESSTPGKPSSVRSWINDKLMGAFDGPNKYREIAKSHPNPEVRQEAQAMWDEYQAGLAEQ